METAKQDKKLTKFLILTLYLAVMVLVVLNVWNDQNAVRKGGDRPLYQNLMECPAYTRRGFDPEGIFSVPQLRAGGEWVRFDAAPLRISNSSLPDLPKRPYLSPWGRDIEEFTIIIAVEMNNAAIEFMGGSISALPGIFLGYIGENWEIFFNGKLLRSEVHLDETGRFDERRSWRDVYFPLDKSLIVPGTNILALRILGDPAYDVTGLFYAAPYYLDDYSIIEKRQQNYLLMILCSISGFTGVYFLLLFFSVRRKREIFYLYYGIFSVLFCVYSITRNGIVNSFIPNSDISIRLEYLTLFLMIPVLCFFVEMIGRGKITKISWAYLGFCLFLSLSQIFFCTQYGDDVLKIWSVSVLIYFSYVFFYSVIYLFFWSQSRSRKLDATMIHIMFGAGLMYACGIFDVLDSLFFHKSFSLFIYSTFVVHFGLAITLLWRYNVMYKQLEDSNVILEATVKKRTLELEKASRAKSEFLATMSHEIRTPLNAVIGLSEIELRREHNKTSRENIAQIQQSSSFLLGIIGDILDISKIEEGKFELIQVQYDTAAMLSSVVNINMIRLASKGGDASKGDTDGSTPVNFILDIDKNFPAQLTGDELRVKQILNNLLSNAIKYTNEGTITLSVSKEEREGTAKVRFTVRDTGVGIRPEDMEKLFESYTQLDSGVKRKTEGTGLGLTIAQNLAALMGGIITAESEYGKGSCFTVEIMQGIGDAPLGDETAENLRNFRYHTAGHAGVLSSGKEAAGLSALPSAKALVVDDKNANLMVARGLLAPYGLSVDTASSGAEAIERIKACHYDLIFIDHMMPGMDGVETAAAIRALEKESGEKGTGLLIIAMTANAMRGMKEYYLEHGFDDYLSKPVNVKELDRIVVRWLGSREVGNREWGMGSRAGDSEYNGVSRMYQNNSNNNPRSLIPDPRSPFAIEIESQRLNMLSHYRASFASGQEIDSDYLKQFTALVQTIASQTLAASNMSGELQEQAAALVSAGQRGDAQVIREKLPAFYNAVNNYQLSLNDEQNYDSIEDILLKLKRALQDGDAPSIEGTPETTGKILADFRAARLDAAWREMFFLLNDLMLEGKTEKAVEAIDKYFEKAASPPGGEK